MNTTDNYRKHTTTNPLQRYLLDRFINELVFEVERLKPESILDVGCGEGFILDRLHSEKIGKKLVGIDILDTAIKLGKKERPHLDLRQGSIYEIDAKDNSFDAVICSEVLEHIDDPRRGLAELERVSKKYVVLSVPNEPFFMLANFLRGKNLSRLGNDIEHINHWSGRGFRKFVSKNLDVVLQRQIFPWTFIVARKR